jgi:hypothetical protein
MNNIEIISFFEHAATVLCSVTNSRANLQAHGSIGYVIKTAESIIKGVDVSNDPIMPPVFIEKMQSFNMTSDVINQFWIIRKEAFDALKECMIYILEKNYLLDAGILNYEFHRIEMGETPRYLTPEHVALLKAKRVMPLDTDMMFWDGRINGLYAAMSYTLLNVRDSFEFVISTHNRDVAVLDQTFSTYQKLLTVEAREQRLTQPNMTVDAFIDYARKKAFIQNALLKPNYIALLNTAGLRGLLDDALRGIVRPAPPSLIVRFIAKAFDEWVACTGYAYCQFESLDLAFSTQYKKRNVDDTAFKTYYYSELIRQASFERLGHYLTDANPNHPVHTLYKLTDAIVSTYHEQNKTISISGVCHEITRVVLRHEQQRLNISMNISYVLGDMPSAYVQLLCEDKRMALADELQTFIPVNATLLLVGRTSLKMASQLASIFVGNLTYSTLSPSKKAEFSRLTENDLTVIMYPISKYNFDVNLAMDLFDNSSPFVDMERKAIELASYQKVKKSFAACNPGAAKQAFFNSRQLLGNISNTVLLDSVAANLVSCMEMRATAYPQFASDYVRIMDFSLSKAQLFVISSSLPLVTLVLVGRYFCNKIKPVSVVKSMFGFLKLGTPSVESNAEKERLIKSSDIRTSLRTVGIAR